MTKSRLWLALCVLVSMPVPAANLAPTITSDEVAAPGAGCSLREAVLQANTNAVVDAACGPVGDAAATDTIVLAPGASYALTLAGAEDLAAAGDLDIVNNAAAVDLSITGNGSTISNASLPKDRVLHVLAGANVAIDGVTISNGLVVAPAGQVYPDDSVAGGGILNEGSLVMSDCGIVENEARGTDGGSGNGAGIASLGPLALTDCLVQGNHAFGGNSGGHASGGGVYQLGLALARLVRTRVEGNRALGGHGGQGIEGRGGNGTGGGLTAQDASLEMADCVIVNNVARGGDGEPSGIFLGFGGTAYGGGMFLTGEQQTVTGTTIAGNRAEGGDSAAGGFATGAQGGGIHKFRRQLTLSNSTLSANAALLGNGIVQGSQALGGGLFSSTAGTLLDSVTITGSTNQGIYVLDLIEITNSIIALQTSGADCAGGNPVTSTDFNIDSDGTCNLVQPNDQPGVMAAALGLLPLADNGGFSETHAIVPGLAAYNRGSTILTTDQRGVARPQWAVDDVGAYEQAGISLAEIPTLSNGAVAAMVGLLAFAALFSLRQRG